MLKLLLLGSTLLFVLVAGPIVWNLQTSEPLEHQASTGLPWQITVMSDGDSQVFGLTPGRSRIDDARAMFGIDMEIAIVAPPGRPARLEAYYPDARAGFITGKLILTAELPDTELDRMRQRALKERFMESATRKVTLHPDDLTAARSTPIRAITFIPSADLDETVIVQRFGSPERRIRSADGVEHFLYPSLGLDIALNPQGREILQYVAPREFGLLLEPLLEDELR